jgi:hypothetical protein
MSMGNSAEFFFDSREKVQFIYATDKAAIGKKKITHSLEDLAKEFVAVVKRELNEDVPSWIIARIKAHPLEKERITH